MFWFVLLKIFLLQSLMAASLPVKISGFLDSYYAYDFNRPHNHRREFTTQPARHNEVNINLAYIALGLETDKVRSRLAMQLGNSVEKNAEAEPGKGKYFQEAYVGKKFGSHTWLDGGIFLSHVGAESWISKDNWTYSRALNLDYVPYYSTGLRLSHRFNQNQSAQFQILNGWQNISENNNAKAIGMQFKQDLSSELLFTYNNFLGDEEVVPNLETGKYHSRFRGYHNFILQWTSSDKWRFLGALDFGHQAQQDNNGVNGFGAATLTTQHILDSKNALAFRAEYYIDPHQSNIITNTKNGFRVIGASLNFDRKFEENVLWRTELRGFKSDDEIYPQGSGKKNDLSGFLVTSLAIWF